MPDLKEGTQPVSRKLRFDVFEVDRYSGELRKYGVRIPLQSRPFQALVFLLQHANDVVPREELQKHLWPADVFVDFEHGLNTAIRKIRRALNDDAANPRFIETVGRLGYRFLVPVEIQDTVPSAQRPATTPVADILPTSSPQVAALREPVVSETTKPGRWRSVGWSLAASLFILVLLLAYYSRPEMPRPRISRAVQLTKSGGVRAREPLFTDGPRLYYQLTGPLASDWELRQVLLNGNEDTPAGVPAGRFRIHGLSPDDTEFLATSFIDGQSTVWTVPVSGGSPHRIGNLIADDISWSHDGKWFAYAQADQLFLAKPDGTSSYRLTKVPEGSSSIDHVRWSPDDRRIRFTVITPTTRALWEIGADGSNLRKMQFPWPGREMECCGEWSRDGRYFVFKSQREQISNLWALEEKADWWRRTNPDPVQLTFGPVNYYEPLPSRDGHSIFATGVEPSGELVRYDAGRKDFVPFLDGRSWAHLAFSRDGQWMAYVAYPEGTLWRARSDGTEQLQLTFPPLQAGAPRWSADGERIAFHAIEPGQVWKDYLISAQGGNPDPFPEEAASQSSPDWVPDRDALTYSRDNAAANHALYIFDRRSGHTEKIAGSEGLYGPLWSPNGRFLMAVDVPADRLVLVDLTSGKRTPIAASVQWPAWSPDSKYIYFARFGVNSIFRVRVPDGKEEKFLSLPFRVAPWPFTVAQDGSVVLLREHGRYNVYALSLAPG
jgi:Tol biopolymer transport system component/DNA-binding winged helix-turn-helix (wHTH) protein